MTYTALKAQQDPHIDWSMISLIDSQLGQLVAEKNYVGGLCKVLMSLIGSFRCSETLVKDPIKYFIC